MRLKVTENSFQVNIRNTIYNGHESFEQLAFVIDRQFVKDMQCHVINTNKKI